MFNIELTNDFLAMADLVESVDNSFQITFRVAQVFLHVAGVIHEIRSQYLVQRVGVGEVVGLQHRHEEKHCRSMLKPSGNEHRVEGIPVAVEDVVLEITTSVLEVVDEQDVTVLPTLQVRPGYETDLFLVAVWDSFAASDHPECPALRSDRRTLTDSPDHLEMTSPGVFYRTKESREELLLASPGYDEPEMVERPGLWWPIRHCEVRVS